MARYDFSAPRLFVEAPLATGSRLPLERAQANYLLNVLRMKDGGSVLLFNGRHGEWRAIVSAEGRKATALVVAEQTRAQTPPSDLLYLFAPLKHARLDYMVQKAVEMGIGALRPVFTRRSQASRVNRERMRANAIEAAEQCGILTVPEVLPEADLASAVGSLEPERLLIFCDEEAPVANPIDALRAAGEAGAGRAILVGPEGGFTDEERALALRHPRVARISLGPRILRADTAAVAALALVQAVIGDWR